MFQLITELKSLLAVERIIRRDRHLPIDDEFMRRASLRAAERFPDDAWHQEAEARTEWFLRRLFQHRPHDA